jgi:raffinose synthase
MTLTLEQRTLSFDGTPLLRQVAEELSAEPDPSGTGIFLRACFAESHSRLTLAVGAPVAMKRFTSLYRDEPYWNIAAAGERVSALKVETQFFMMELESGLSALVVPLVDAPFRCSLESGPDESLVFVAETGDPMTAGSSMLALYVAAGRDPYALVAAAAKSVAARLGTGRLRAEKPLPDFVEWFGWCTWDAFYQDVSHANVKHGLETFREGGVVPRWLILDDGWQSRRRMPTGEDRLTAFAANEKFPGDLAPTVKMAKEEFGLKRFLVWHAFQGYWGGVDGAALPEYGVRETIRHFSPGLLGYNARLNFVWWGALVGFVPPAHIHRFYQDYHRHLAEQGVDGIKVDNQAANEGLGHGLGGRVAVMQAYREALEGSALVHFEGRLINCMSNSNEMIYSARASTLMRTSIDFWPKKPETHGMHLYTNAQTALWFGEFIHPDWDMFQSGHAMGAFHAAGRAVSGGAVYVSDKPEEHDFDLLQKLVLSDGSVLRARGIGRPTRDCLYHDPTRERVLLKVFNVNLEAGVLGVFNARHDAEPAAETPVEGTVSPSDVIGLAGSEFAVYAHHARTLARAARESRLPVRLGSLTAEVFTLVPIDGGVAPIGLADKFNSGGAITAKGWEDKTYRVALRDGGRFVAFAERRPSAVLVDGEAHAFSYEENAVMVEIAAGKARDVALRFA